MAAIAERVVQVAAPTPTPTAAAAPPVPPSVLARLYTSHFLSTWNSRVFEFGAVLFVQSAYPDTLLPISVYALARSAAAVLAGQPVGDWIDGGQRLGVVRASIVAQRVAVAASCVVFWLMEVRKGAGSLRTGLFAVAVALACVEKVGSVMNLVAVERDWVVAITVDDEPARRVLNARMRRIDLVCKLVGPLVISAIIIPSTLAAIWATLGMNTLAVPLEYMCIAHVYHGLASLQRDSITAPGRASQDAGHPSRPKVRDVSSRVMRHIFPLDSLSLYLHHPAFVPSFALSLLYLTVLSFSGQMITYLLSVGYTSLHVGLARTVSTMLELSATWIAPRLMKRIGLVRGGIWSLSWQMILLTLAVALFLGHLPGLGTVSSAVMSATGLAVGVALSRIGLWGYDLCAQNIVQEEVQAEQRGAFSMVEASFQNLFELISYLTTIIFSRTDQFKWPVLISVGAVYLAGGLYTAFVRKRRGHLFHAPPCFGATDPSQQRPEVIVLSDRPCPAPCPQSPRQASAPAG